MPVFEICYHVSKTISTKGEGVAEPSFATPSVCAVGDDSGLFHILKCGTIFFAGTDLDNTFHTVDKNFTIADVTGIQNLFGCVNDLLNRDLTDNYFHLGFRQQGGIQLNAAIFLSGTFLDAHSHTDKLTNYIRFWQADGESEKTSIRTKTALGQLVEGGGFKGGLAPYGYDLVKSGRFNKRKHELYDLVVNETEAAVVRIIFDKYVHEGFGAQRIATYLNKQGYRARTGKMWHHASIRGIVCNLTYTGVLRCGESRSQELPHLQIISPELFEAAQHIRTSRANSAEQERHIPLNTRGNSLLAGNVYCGHCGARLSLTTNGKAYPCKEDPNRMVKRVRYVCYGKTRKQTDCDGQTGYTAHILDGIIDKLVRQIFERMKAIPKSDIVNIRYREKMEERKSLLHSVRAEYAKAAADLETLKGEVIKTIRGESTFSKELLSSLIAEAEAKCQELQESMKTAQAAYDEGKTVLASLNAQYDDIISWAEMYDTASVEAKKMIVSCLIKRVEVYRDYKLHIDFNIDFEQFTGGLDIVAIAA